MSERLCGACGQSIPIGGGCIHCGLDHYPEASARAQRIINNTLIEDLLDYAKAYEGRSGTAGYAICARNAAREIEALRNVLRAIRRTAMRDGNPEQNVAGIIDMVDQEID